MAPCARGHETLRYGHRRPTTSWCCSTTASRCSTSRVRSTRSPRPTPSARHYRITHASLTGADVIGQFGRPPRRRRARRRPAGALRHAAGSRVAELAGQHHRHRARRRRARPLAAQPTDGLHLRGCVPAGGHGAARRSSGRHALEARPSARRALPEVTVDAASLFVTDGKYVTSAGVTAGIDLVLSLIEHDHGPALAREVARDLVVFMARPGDQSQFSVRLEALPTNHSVVRARHGRHHREPAVATTRLASLAAEAGVSPAASVAACSSPKPATPHSISSTATRLEAACAALTGGPATLDQVAEQTWTGVERVVAPAVPPRTRHHSELLPESLQDGEAVTGKNASRCSRTNAAHD